MTYQQLCVTFIKQQTTKLHQTRSWKLAMLTTMKSSNFVHSLPISLKLEFEMKGFNIPSQNVCYSYSNWLFIVTSSSIKSVLCTQTCWCWVLVSLTCTTHTAQVIAKWSTSLLSWNRIVPIHSYLPTPFCWITITQTHYHTIENAHKMPHKFEIGSSLPANQSPSVW